MSRSILSGHHNPGSWLRVFDFDETLVSPVSPDHPLFHIIPGVLIPKLHYQEILRNIYRNSDNDVIICTARTDALPVYDYLNRFLNLDIDVFAVGSDSATNKADLIDRLIQINGYRNVEYWDDYEPFLRAVNNLRLKYRDAVNIITHRVPVTLY